jgi:hypothetical protein
VSSSKKGDKQAKLTLESGELAAEVLMRGFRKGSCIKRTYKELSRIPVKKKPEVGS